jgi:hypothetical protein
MYEPRPPDNERVVTVKHERPALARALENVKNNSHTIAAIPHYDGHPHYTLVRGTWVVRPRGLSIL